MDESIQSTDDTTTFIFLSWLFFFQFFFFFFYYYYYYFFIFAFIGEPRIMVDNSTDEEISKLAFEGQDGLLQHALSFLDVVTLVQTKPVNKRWRDNCTAAIIAKCHHPTPFETNALLMELLAQQESLDARRAQEDRDLFDRWEREDERRAQAVQAMFSRRATEDEAFRQTQSDVIACAKESINASSKQHEISINAVASREMKIRSDIVQYFSSGNHGNCNSNSAPENSAPNGGGQGDGTGKGTEM